MPVPPEAPVELAPLPVIPPLAPGGAVAGALQARAERAHTTGALTRVQRFFELLGAMMFPSAAAILGPEVPVILKRTFDDSCVGVRRRSARGSSQIVSERP